jgi:hypothetical protein
MQPQTTFEEAFKGLQNFQRNQSPPLEGTESAALALRRVHYTHDAMIDLLVSNPGMSQNQLAAHFGYSVPWISRIINSDAFQARLAVRKGDLVDPALLLTVEERLTALCDQSLNIVMDKLESTKNIDTAMKALELSTKALGFGARKSNVTLQQSFVVALPSKVVDSGEWAERHRASLGAGALASPSPASSQAQEIQFVETATVAVPTP